MNELMSISGKCIPKVEFLGQRRRALLCLIIIAKQPAIFPSTLLINFRRGGADWWEDVIKGEDEPDPVMFLQL